MLILAPSSCCHLQARCVSVLKPTGHYSHIANHGTDQEALKELQAAHAAGQGPGVSITMVKANGAQVMTAVCMTSDNDDKYAASIGQCMVTMR